MNREQAITRLLEVIRRKHLALKTEQAYRRYFVQYLDFLATVPASWSSEQKLEKFLTKMALADYSAVTQNCAFNAILFWYRECLGVELQRVNALRAKRGQRVRQAPSPNEARALLAAIVDADGYPTRLIVRLLYECGLRVSEPLNLRVRDIDLANSALVIRGAKGNQGRLVHLPCALAEPLRTQLATARAVWQQDRANGLPVTLPTRMAQKYPAARFSWQCAYVFPLRNPCRHPRTGETVRYRCLESTVQRAVKRACQRLDLAIVPHELRHAYATHNLARGVNLKALSAAMGHKQIETTAGYCHADALSVPSPMETH